MTAPSRHPTHYCLSKSGMSQRALQRHRLGRSFDEYTTDVFCRIAWEQYDKSDLTHRLLSSSMSIMLVLFCLIDIALVSLEPSQPMVHIQTKFNNEAMISRTYSTLTQDSEERRATGA